MKKLKKKIWTVLFSAILFHSMSSCSGQYRKGFVRTLSGRPVKVSQLENRIAHLMDSIGIPGVSIAIVNDAKVVYHDTFGVENVETGEPVTEQTIFEAASLSKPVFAYFVMKMVEQGDLDLDEPIFPYLESAVTPEVFSEAIDSISMEHYKTITPRMVLSHGTGIPNWAEGRPIHIAFVPGTGFSYSGEAYQHLAAALGTKLGIGWGSGLDTLFLKKVAWPIGMERSFYTWNDTLERYKAKGHQKGAVTLKIHRNQKVGSGYSLHSEALDYAHFLMEMMRPNNLKQELVDEMLKEQNHFGPDNELFMENGQTGWGLGLAQKPTPHGLMHLHTGNNHDFQSYAMFVPEQKYGFVLFVNSDNLHPFLLQLEELIEEQF
ncbi:serine hydrolase domain-containing protein [Ulvibacterium sp.]|uniref:serine hydrolase domain-containing protein n=1 Tax=Ulvibacterium sp. TaxID=2665914 RepID=UPI003BAC6705